MPKILIADKLSEDGVQVFQSAGADFVVVCDYDITPEDLLKRIGEFDALEQDPRDSQNPRYQGERYAISHYKPIWRGVSRELRVISKGGRAYGFEVDNAYLAHRQSGRSMFIAIVAYANPNEIVNDDGYAYHLTASLFEAIAGELSRWLTAP